MPDRTLFSRAAFMSVCGSGAQQNKISLFCPTNLSNARALRTPQKAAVHLGDHSLLRLEGRATIFLIYASIIAAIPISLNLIGPGRPPSRYS